MEPLALFERFVEAVQGAAQACAPELPEAASSVRRCSGLVICTGAGKSGLVARKLAASLRTAGRRAAWLDPGAAAHGEAGLLGPSDLLVVVSRSGESDEVVELALQAPCSVMAITGRPGSRLGRAAHSVLDCGQVPDPEGGPPTASFLAACAVVDALVLLVGAVPAATGSHPAGAVGRGQRIPVGKVMHAPPTVEPELSVPELLGTMTRHGLGAVVLVERGSLAGIVTDGDLRRAVERHGPSVLTLAAGDIATPRPVTVRDSAPIAHAMRLMEDRPSQIAVLPVLDDGDRVVGLVRIHDLVRAGLG